MLFLFFKSICNLTKSKVESEEDVINELFSSMDVNNDQRISREEFIQGALQNDFVVKLLQPDPDS